MKFADHVKIHGMVDYSEAVALSLASSESVFYHNAKLGTCNVSQAYGVVNFHCENMALKMI